MESLTPGPELENSRANNGHHGLIFAAAFLLHYPKSDITFEQNSWTQWTDSVE